MNHKDDMPIKALWVNDWPYCSKAKCPLYADSTTVKPGCSAFAESNKVCRPVISKIIEWAKSHSMPLLAGIEVSEK